MLNSQTKINYDKAIVKYESELKNTEPYSYLERVRVKHGTWVGPFRGEPEYTEHDELRYDQARHSIPLKAEADKVKQAALSYKTDLTSYIQNKETQIKSAEKTNEVISEKFWDLKTQIESMRLETNKLKTDQQKLSKELESLQKNITATQPTFEAKLNTLEAHKTAHTKFENKFCILTADARITLVFQLLSQDSHITNELTEIAFIVGVDLDLLANKAIMLSSQPALNLAISKGFDINNRIKQIIDEENLEQMDKLCDQLFGSQYIDNCLINSLTPLQYSLKHNKTKIVEKMLSTNPSCAAAQNTKGEDTILYAIKHIEDANLIKFLIENTPSTSAAAIFDYLIANDQDALALKFAKIYPDLIDNKMFIHLISLDKYSLTQLILEQDEFKHLNNPEYFAELHTEFMKAQQDSTLLDLFTDFINITQMDTDFLPLDLLADGAL